MDDTFGRVIDTTGWLAYELWSVPELSNKIRACEELDLDYVIRRSVQEDERVGWDFFVPERLYIGHDRAKPAMKEQP